jgi:hypothetical protein
VRLGTLCSALLLSLFAVLAAALGIRWVAPFGTQPAGAQGVNVAITELSCDANPEMVVITNQGTEAIPMTGWNLQSDPPAQESLPLSSLGSLAGGQSLLVESGPGSEAAFVWSREFIFRDKDATDFAQLASDAGDVLLKVNCGSVTSQGTPAATASPGGTTPGPTPTVLSSSVVPVSGGPAAVTPLIPPAALIAAGSALLFSGIVTFAIPWPRRRRPALDAGVGEVEEEAQIEIPSRGDSPFPSAAASKQEHDPPRQYLFLAAVVLALITLLVFLLQVEAKKE